MRGGSAAPPRRRADRRGRVRRGEARRGGAAPPPRPQPAAAMPAPPGTPARRCRGAPWRRPAARSADERTSPGNVPGPVGWGRGRRWGWGWTHRAARPRTRRRWSPQAAPPHSLDRPPASFCSTSPTVSPVYFSPAASLLASFFFLPSYSGFVE